MPNLNPREMDILREARKLSGANPQDVKRFRQALDNWICTEMGEAAPHDLSPRTETWAETTAYMERNYRPSRSDRHGRDPQSEWRMPDLDESMASRKPRKRRPSRVHVEYVEVAAPKKRFLQGLTDCAIGSDEWRR